MKHLLTLALVLCLGTFASAQIPSYVPPNGLVGWWPFNGNANDESGNGRNGTVNGAILGQDRNGVNGKAYSFNGQGANISASCNGFSTGERTISFWFYANDIGVGSSGRNVIGYGGNGICGTSFLIVIDNADKSGNNYEVQGHCNNQVVYFDYGLLHPNGNWKNWTITVNSTNGTKFYLDGQLFHTSSIFINQTSTSNGNIFFGTGTNFSGSAPFWDSNALPFNGLLDDIAIYNRALTAAEVQQLYLANCTQPSFTAQPQNKSVGQGQTTTFAVQVDTTATFQWQMNLGLGAGWVNIPQSSLFSGDTTATLSVQGRSTIDGAQFRCIATACQSDTSNAATLTVTSNASTLGSVAGVPGKINYQGAAVDSLGKPMKNQTIALKLSVLDSSSTGAAAYVETHSTPTNGSGLFSLQIGGGTVVSGTFDSIPWANGRNKHLKTEVQQNGTWVNLGTSQLVSVPYALVAGKAIEATSATFFKDSLGNAYQIKTVNGQPTLVSAPGNNPSPGTFACGQSVSYAGESYPTVQIGTQCWFQKNVNVGTMVLGANDQTNNGTLEKYCYNNDPANCNIYGGLYQWAEAVQYQNGASNTTSPSPAFSGNIKGICPTGWHVPSDGEFFTLSHYLDTSAVYSLFGTYSSIAGGALKSTRNLWNSPNTGATNNSGFSALPGGDLDYGHGFFGQGELTYFWTKSDFSVSPTDAIDIVLFFDYSIVFGDNITKSWGFSVRCLKD